MGFTLRRSLPSITGLLGLLLAVGVAAVIWADAPVWFPAVFAIVFLLVQYAVNPLIIQWLVPATVIDHDGERYLTDHAVGEVVAKRCRQAGVPLVKLGIVDDGNPNAFTFGRTPRDARMWITRGLLERLDDRELDAVVSHEVGHVKHWDFAVMTLAAVVPMVLYLTFLVTRGNRRAAYVAIGAYVAYWVSYFTLLALSRAREYAADHWSAEGLSKLRERVESVGIKLDMVPLPMSSNYITRFENPNIMLGKSPERDREIDNICQMIRNAAKAGIPALKYNLSILGVVRTEPTPGRGGAKYSTFVYDKARQEPPLTEAGPVSEPRPESLER